MNLSDLAARREDYARDGVMLLKDALTPEELRLAREAYDWSLANPGPSRFNVMAGTEGRFFTDTSNPRAYEQGYKSFLHKTGLIDAVAALWDVEDVWFLYEQIFVKEGGETVRTPWHQDTSYAPIDGMHIAAFWICFEPFPAEQSLEFIPGTHHGPLYDGSALDGANPLRPLYGNGELPLLPDIDGNRENWNIISYAVEPGDVVVFHPSVLHGGAGTRPGQSRHTLTFKVFGPDAVVGKRPEVGAGVKDMPKKDKAAIPLGQPYSVLGGPKLRSRAA